MRPKGKLFALLAVFAAIGLVTATGAFTTVTASRTADVTAAGDDSALLGIEEGNLDDNGPNVDYIQTNQQGDGELSIVLESVNANATTTLVEAIKISNRGSQEVAVEIGRNGENAGAIAFGVQKGELASAPNNGHFNWPGYEVYRIDGDGKPIDLQPGESVQVSIFIDTSDSNAGDGLSPGTAVVGSGEEILSDVTISADAGAADGDDDSMSENYDAKSS